MNEQNFPNITLVIESKSPRIEFRKDSQNYNSLINGVNLEKLLIDKAKQATDMDLSLSQILELVSVSDERYLFFPVESSNLGKLDFTKLDQIIQGEIESYEKFESDNPELDAELERNWLGDVLASTLWEIYTIMIADTVHLASEFGIGEIQLEEDLGDPRLREKMSVDLKSVGAELVVRS